jgi:hypothetical protein
MKSKLAIAVISAIAELEEEAFAAWSNDWSVRLEDAALVGAADFSFWTLVGPGVFRVPEAAEVLATKMAARAPVERPEARTAAEITAMASLDFICTTPLPCRAREAAR